MDVFEAIRDRRSIRIFKAEPVPEDMIRRLLEVAVLAPSVHNIQPWRFVVLEEVKKNELVEVLNGVYKKFKESGIPTDTFKRTIGCIRRSNAVILVYNASPNFKGRAEKEKVKVWSVEIQSLGAAIQNMLLQAHAMNLGTLWISDVFYAEAEISLWLHREEELVAAVSLGYADELPNPRPRMQWEKVTEWLK
jgi:nitroreductase